MNETKSEDAAKVTEEAATAAVEPPKKKQRKCPLKGSTRVQFGSTIDKAMRAQFGYLGLQEMETVKEIGKTRTRNHVNPLGKGFLTPIDPPDWATVFADPTLPLFVDIGCAAGRYGLQAAQHPSWKGHNHLGLEIRLPLVIRANCWAKNLKLTNVHYLTCSANASLYGLLKAYPGPVSWVCVQFPDPQFKRKHHKRRVVQDQFLKELSEVMLPGSTFFVQSDVEEAAAQMRDRTSLSGFFTRKGDYSPRSELISLDKCCGDGGDLWTVDGKRDLQDDGKPVPPPPKKKKKSRTEERQKKLAAAAAAKEAADQAGEAGEAGEDKSEGKAEEAEEAEEVAVAPTPAVEIAEVPVPAVPVPVVPKNMDTTNAVSPNHPDYGDWLLGPNPTEVPTEREVQNTALKLPIYRAVFTRTELAFKPEEDKEEKQSS